MNACLINRNLTVALFMIAAWTSCSLAGGHCCDRCGCDEPCHKVCRLVKEEKKVEIVCFGGKPQEFCVPGPSKQGCKHCETVCTNCDQPTENKDPAKKPDPKELEKKKEDAKVQSKPKRFVWFDWTPGRATIHTKMLLMKKTETKTIPSYKWVVEDLCEKCRHAPAGSKPSGDEKPAKEEKKTAGLVPPFENQDGVVADPNLQSVPQASLSIEHAQK